MFVIDVMKDIMVIAALMAFACLASSAASSWNSLPEYVWHLKGQ